jgi:hypothetical protein
MACSGSTLTLIALITADDFALYKGITRELSVAECNRIEAFINRASRWIEIYVKRPLLPDSTIDEPVSANAEISYAAYADVDAIPLDITDACMLLVDWRMLLASNIGVSAWSDTDKQRSLNLSMPTEITRLLEPYRYFGDPLDLSPDISSFLDQPGFLGWTI